MTNEEEETQQDESSEYAEGTNMEARGGLDDNPEIFTNVIGVFDNLKDQVETVANGLDVVRHDLGEIQFRIQQNLDENYMPIY